MKSRSFILALVLSSAICYMSVAGDRSNIRGVGMGRTINAASRGVDAIGINPANIAIPEVRRFTLNLVPIGLRVSTDLVDYGIYQEYFTGVDSAGKRNPKMLETSDQNKILSQMPDLPENRIETELMTFGASFQNPIVGGIAFAITEHAGCTSTLSKDFFRMAVFGLDSNGSTYTFGGTGISAWWYREYNLSYGRKLPVKLKFLKDLYAGIGLKFIRGYGIFQTVRQNSSFNNYPESPGSDMYNLKGTIDYLAMHAGVDFFNNNDSAHVPFTIFPDPVGSGTGFDIGFSGELINGMRVALSITDIGKITWDKNVLENIGVGPFEFTQDLKTLEDTVKNIVNGIPRPVGSFTTNLPTALRLGFMMDVQRLPFIKRNLPRKLLFAVDYVQGFNESLGNTTKPRFSLGAEYRLVYVLPLRTGLVFGGGDKVRWAFGFGLDLRYFSWDFATDSFATFFTPKSFQMVSFSMGMKVRI